MINLLSREIKKEMYAAQRNVTIRRYVFTLLSLIAIITVTFGVSYSMLLMQEDTYNQTIKKSQVEKAIYNKDVKAGAEYVANLRTAKNILSKELLFSDVLTNIAFTLPPRAALVDITLDVKTISKPIDLNIGLSSYDDAVAVKNAFQDSSFFKDTKIKTIVKNQGGDDYAYRLILTTILDKEAFIKAQAEAKS